MLWLSGGSTWMAMAAVAIRVPVVTDESREQIVLDEEFLGRISLRCCSPNRPYHLPSSCLINLTYGKRLEANHEGMDLLDSGPKEVPVSRREPCCWSQGRGYGGKEDQGCVGSLILTPRYLASILRCQTHLRGQFGRLRPDEPSSKPMQPVKQVEQQKNSTDTQKHSDGKWQPPDRPVKQGVHLVTTGYYGPPTLAGHGFKTSGGNSKEAT
eukprot:Em0008g1096a